VGVGSLGQHHARIHAESPATELVAVVDIRPERAREIAERHGCLACSDFREVLDKVDAVSLVVPTCAHSEVGVELLEAGVHVLVEKPIADSLEAADALIAAAQRSGSVLHVGHSERFNPALTAVREFVTQPRFFEAHRMGVFVPRSLDVDVVLDLMIHDLDLILHLSNQPIREIRAVGIPILTPRIDIANARLEFENGCVANITASRVSSEKTRKLRFFQPNDYVSIDFTKQDSKVFSLVEGRKIIKREFDLEQDQPLRIEIEAFLAAVQGRKDGPIGACSGPEGRRALELALRLLNEMAG
jgi:predicted dehydrogenase